MVMEEAIDACRAGCECDEFDFVKYRKTVDDTALGNSLIFLSNVEGGVDEDAGINDPWSNGMDSSDTDFLIFPRVDDDDDDALAANIDAEEPLPLSSASSSKL